jgi:hypothetical protein
MDEQGRKYRYVKLTGGKGGGLQKPKDAMNRKGATLKWLSDETGFADNSLDRYLRGARTFLYTISCRNLFRFPDPDERKVAEAVRGPI